MNDLHDLTAIEQLRALRQGEVTSVELTHHYLRRIEAHGARLGAFTSVFPEQALDAARTADDRRSAGRDDGCLAGLPLVLKDLHPSAGLPTSMGSAALAGWVPEEDAPAIAALRAAGPVIVGKTHAPEFGPTCYTESTLASAAVTPYDETRSASGSSGGAAVAVAAGLAPVAHASDGLGSIRTPAANCGLVGVKPSRGRLTGSGLDWLGLAVEGPVARTVADAALFLDALGPARVHEPWAWGRSATAGTHLDARDRPIERRLRIGVLTDPGIDVAVDPECLSATALAARGFENLGYHVSEVDTFPLLGELEDDLVRLVACRVAALVPTLVPPGRRDRLMPFTSWLLEQATAISGVDLTAVQGRLAAATAAWLRVLASVDVLLTPTTTAPPRRVGAHRLDDQWQSARTMLRWSAFTPWANLAGAPAISLPVHVTASGLPVGVQITARPGHDPLLLALAGQLEDEVRWDRRHPPVWAAPASEPAAVSSRSGAEPAVGALRAPGGTA